MPKRGASSTGPKRTSAQQRFVRQPGSARAYLDTQTGQTISRRQRDAIAEREGQRTLKPQGIRQSVEFGKLARQYAQRNDITTKEARQSKEFRDLYQKVRGSKAHKYDAQTRKEAAIKLGARDGVPDKVDFGDSDKWRKFVKQYSGPKNMKTMFVRFNQYKRAH